MVDVNAKFVEARQKEFVQAVRDQDLVRVNALLESLREFARRPIEVRVPQTSLAPNLIELYERMLGIKIIQE